MAGFLRFVAFFVLLVAVFVLVVLPFLLSPFLTQMVRNAGLQAQTLDVTVAPLDPTLILGRARRVSLVATGVDLAPAQIGRIDVSVGDASWFDRSFQTVSGELDDISLTVGGDRTHVSSVTIDGPARTANATARLSPSDTEQLIRLAARRAGVEVDSVSVGDAGVSVRVRGVDANARVAVQGGALILDPGVGGAIVLLQPAPSDPWSLSEAWISAEGLNVRGTVDVSRLTESLAN